MSGRGGFVSRPAQIMAHSLPPAAPICHYFAGPDRELDQPFIQLLASAFSSLTTISEVITLRLLSNRSILRQNRVSLKMCVTSIDE
jgi:hypothetical protein